MNTIDKSESIAPCACGAPALAPAGSGGFRGSWTIRCSNAECPAVVKAPERSATVLRWNALALARAHARTAKALIVIEGVASSRRTPLVANHTEAWVGTPAQSVSSDFDGWLPGCLLPLRDGGRYRCEVFELPSELQSVHEAHLPSDQSVRGERAEFFSMGKPVRNWKWPGDRRRKLVDPVGVWTDGLMVATTDGTLQIGRAYRVVVVHLPE